MKKYFLTGFVLLLPLVLTILIVTFVLHLATKPFEGLIQSILSHTGFFTNELLLIYSSHILSFLLFIVLVLGIGFAGRWVVTHMFLRGLELVLRCIPFVNGVYNTCRDVVHTLFNRKNPLLGEVVLVPFPNKEMLSIGWIMGDKETGSESVSVFVPTSPNITFGYLMKFPRDQLIVTDMKVDDVLKSFISCGSMLPNFSIGPKNEN